jgi:hypothetical protein
MGNRRWSLVKFLRSARRMLPPVSHSLWRWSLQTRSATVPLYFDVRDDITMYTLLNNIIFDIFQSVVICVDFLGTLMASLVLFFKTRCGNYFKQMSLDIILTFHQVYFLVHFNNNVIKLFRFYMLMLLKIGGPYDPWSYQ